ncbi:MAG: hypothetical protein CVT62_05125 [Actinobacteria bacterium HGW-Actinobacteria-2]|nr:MAG: hypothetical protein CVT62_05125 [Actinobacteria bacterium HGW-Actinobacteria-2]
MNDLNWLLLLVAFLAGVIFTLMWSLRAVTRKVAAEQAASEPEAVATETEPETKPEPETTEAALTTVTVGAATEAGSSTEDAEVISWWDRAFVANRPAPAISPTESEPGIERNYRGTANRDLLGPAGERIKGSRESMLYHTIASPYYGRTDAEEWFATEADAEAAGFTRWDRRKSMAAATGTPGADASSMRRSAANPSHRNGAGRRGKSSKATIKGNRGSMLYHTVDSPYYGRTKAEEWFATEADAVAAGYRRWDHKRAQRG